jgi:D-glycero-D-manno-heptose 1,7-bisphosphate phosphatase
MKRFEDAGAPLDGLYYCPHLPDGQVAEYAVECDCRKPKPGLILRAADELGIDIGASYIVGDAERDIVAGRAAGCKGAALIRPESAAADDVETDADVLVPGVETAVNWIRHIEKTENE